jgi:hypothetical protein
LALAIVGGLGLAIGYAFVRDRVDDALRNPADVELRLGIPLLGVVPEVMEGTPMDQLEQPKSIISDVNRRPNGTQHRRRTGTHLIVEQSMLPARTDFYRQWGRVSCGF